MRFAIAAAMALLGSGVAVQAEQPAPGSALGTWINPRQSVAVRTAECGDRLCGWIVWASGEAQADARDGGVSQLVGTKLLEDYERRGNGSWSGKVYVPDMGHRFSSTITQARSDQLVVKGCLVGGFFCRTQVWTRTTSAPHD